MKFGVLRSTRNLYKKNAANTSRGILIWGKDIVFTARICGYAIDFDADAKEGYIPTDSLLMGLPSCLAIDVSLFLKKMKVEIARFDIIKKDKERRQ